MKIWKNLAIVFGGVAAATGQFWGANYYLPLVGGITAAILALIPD